MIFGYLDFLLLFEMSYPLTASILGWAAFIQGLHLFYSKLYSTPTSSPESRVNPTNRAQPDFVSKVNNNKK